MKKTVFFDTNMLNSDGSYYIDVLTIEGRGFKNGDEVIAYQEGEEWDAIIILNDGIWGVQLISLARKISEEKRIGYEEGFWGGYYAQQLRFSAILKQVKLSKEDLNKILEKM